MTYLVPKDAPSLGPSNDVLVRGEWTQNRQAQDADRREVRRIEAKNKAFAALTPEAKRVTIAQDALDQLLGRNLLAATGVYIRMEGGAPHRSEVSKLNGHQCTVCALGALFVGATDVTELKISDSNNKSSEDYYRSFGERLRDRLAPYFSEDQLLAVEAAFETSPMCCPLDDAAIAFGECFIKDTERLTAILRNIIANNGTFDPTQLPVVPEPTSAAML